MRKARGSSSPDGLGPHLSPAWHWAQWPLMLDPAHQGPHGPPALAKAGQPAWRAPSTTLQGRARENTDPAGGWRPHSGGGAEGKPHSSLFWP